MTGLTEMELHGLFGHRFSGGRYRIEHWDRGANAALGRVSAVAEVGGERRATCEVWLDRHGEHVVTGTAVVVLVGDWTDD